MLSPTTRILTGITGALFLVLGAVLFLAPEWSGANFSWPLTRLLAMTMGAWYLGAAAMAMEVVRRWRWPEVYACLVFLWSFGILEAAVLLGHRQVLQMEALLAWPYAVVLAWAGLAGVLGVIDWIRLRPTVVAEGRPIPAWVRVCNVSFVLGVALIAGYAFLGGRRGGTVWPDVLPPLEVRGFGAFYAALALGALVLLAARHITPVRVYGYTGLVMIAFILTPAFLHLDRWDFAARPLGLIYFAAYIVVGIATLIGLAVVRDPAASVQRSAAALGRSPQL